MDVRGENEQSYEDQAGSLEKDWNISSHLLFNDGAFVVGGSWHSKKVCTLQQEQDFRLTTGGNVAVGVAATMSDYNLMPLSCSSQKSWRQ
jgi:hypothetical protein